MARILVMIKPWGIDYSQSILSELDRVGKRLETTEVNSIPEEAVKLQHEKYKNESFFQLMIEDLVGKQSIVAIYEGNQNIFNKQKELLREKFERDIPQLSPLRRNAIHISSSSQEFNRDFNAWRNYLEWK